jgi:hypothetical protein
MDRIDADRWVAMIPIQEIHLAARLRRMRDVEVLPADDCLWLQGPLWEEFDGQEGEHRLLRLIPGVRPYLLAADGQLTRVGDLVPSARLPDGQWQPLADWLRVELPPATTRFPGRLSPAPLSLVRSGEELPSTLLVTTFSLWSDYAASAPQWRLERLVFAVDSLRRVVIRGAPLPPLPGERRVEQDGCSTPVGWTWNPPVQAAVLRESFALQRQDLLLLEHDSWQVVQEGDWVRATRSAVRATAKEHR